MKMSCSFSIAGALVLAIGLAGVFAEAPPTSQKKPIESFTDVSQRRTQLIPEIERLKTELDDLQRQKGDLVGLQGEKRNSEIRKRGLEQALKNTQGKLATAESEEKKNLDNTMQLIKEQLDAENNRLTTVTEDLKDVSIQIKDVDEKIKTKQDDLATRQADYNAANARINELLNVELPRQNFKFWMSATFAALVGLVIIGFFIIAWGDERVRQAIFSGTAGIQFVTLFSLVIAIILFGIIEILEGKELAALLGGLSGYILGRATSEHGSAQPEQPSRDQSVPLGTQPQPPVQSQPALQPSVGNGAVQHAQP